MNVNLDSLKLDLGGLDDDSIEGLGREQYRIACIDSNGRGIRVTHDGEDVEFWESRFDHAFFTGTNKEVLEKRRIARIKWICEVIGGRAPNSDCWEVSENLRKRFYRVVGKGYIIWLEKYQAECWTFSTAYIAPIAHLHKQTRGNGAKRIWKYGQKNAP
ncbi:MAG: hypothetical protein QOG23_1639 [Blastocatellia bacterium]|jgi:hypothetical protein|nr:hypothetical protein [Blastocatellia bacterium]